MYCIIHIPLIFGSKGVGVPKTTKVVLVSELKLIG